MPSTASNEKVKLIISFGNKEFISNDFYLPANEAKETVIIEGDVDHISWLKSPTFSLDYRDYGATFTIDIITSETIPLEAFVLYDEPADFYTNGVWAEALRFLFNNTGITGDKDITLSAGKITHYCNSQHGVVYDTVWGEPCYIEYLQTLSAYLPNYFYLLSYMKKIIPSSSAKTVLSVNCVDQGNAVRFLGGAIGLHIMPVQIAPFGYINKINLVGIGPCNNPFLNAIFPGYSREKEFSGLTDKNGNKKTNFGMHHFARLAGTTYDKWNIKDSKILDACALPILANGDLDTNLYPLGEYLTKSIDMLLDISEKKGITEIKSKPQSDIFAHNTNNYPEKVGNANDYAGIIFDGTIQYNNLKLIYK